jgi:hypothetical protein
MNPQKMTERYDYTNPEHAHFRIDELAKTVSDLTDVVGSHSKDIDSIKQAGRAIKTSLYTLAIVIATAELGFWETLRSVIGI